MERPDPAQFATHARSSFALSGECCEHRSECGRLQRELRFARTALKKSQEHHRWAAELSPQIPWTARPDGKVTLDGGDRWFNLTGFSPEEGCEVASQAVHPDDAGARAKAWAKSVRTGEPYDIEYRLRLHDGSYRWFRSRAVPRFDECGRVGQWYGTLEDVHDRRTVEEQFLWAATHDALTGLPNRLLFQQCLLENVERAGASDGKVGLLMLDIDRLKHTNDLFGHVGGDTLLKSFVARVSEVVDPECMVARLGGDEFGIVMRAEDLAELERLAGEIFCALKEPFPIGWRSQECRVSIGMALFPDHGDNELELLKYADIALHEAKRKGGGQAQVFNGDMASVLQRRLTMISVAKDALAMDRVEPFYQPKVDLHTGQVVGFEALLRWHHPTMGVQGPATIAAAFGDPRVALDLSDRMFDLVVRDMAHWVRSDIQFGKIAVNVAEVEFRRVDFPERILERLERAGLPASRLEVEVTETVFMGGRSDHVGQALKQLCEAGVTIALDDFGTGYASLTHLKRFPVDVLKVDQSFVRDLATDGDDAAIVRAIMGLGKGLGLSVIAEGIETREQAALLIGCGCELGQGYLFGKAIPACDVPARLSAPPLKALSPSANDQGRARLSRVTASAL